MLESWGKRCGTTPSFHHHGACRVSACAVSPTAVAYRRRTWENRGVGGAEGQRQRRGIDRDRGRGRDRDRGRGEAEAEAEERQRQRQKQREFERTEKKIQYCKEAPERGLSYSTLALSKPLPCGACVCSPATFAYVGIFGPSFWHLPFSTGNECTFCTCDGATCAS